MANRGASAAIINEAGQDRNQPIHLFELYLDGGTQYVTDAYRAIDWGGNTYVANGHLLSFEGIDEDIGLQVNQASVSLSGVDQTLVASVLASNVIDRRLVIRKAFLSMTDMSVIVDPIVLFDGRCDAPEINEDPDSGACVVSLKAASQWVDFERRPGRHTNHEEQQLWFPGDLGFEFVSQLNKEIKWGVV